MKILATVAARGGSKGVKKKNIRLLMGKPLIAYTIEQALKWGKYEKLIVSSDSKDIIDTAVKHGAEAPFIRPAEISGDTTGKVEVLRHALSESEKYYNTQFDALLDLDVTSPIRTVNDIDNIVNLFREKNADTVFSVVEARRNPYFNIVEENQDGTVGLSKKLENPVLSRQTGPRVFDMNASLYVYSRDYILDRSNINQFGGKTYAYLMSEHSATDIDSEFDFKLIELMVKEGIVKI